MSEWLTAESTFPNWGGVLFVVLFYVLLSFCMWALGDARKRLREAQEFYEAYLADDDDDAIPPHPPVQERTK